MDQSNIFDMTAYEYLRHLADRILHIPVSNGVDQADFDRLRGIASELEEKVIDKPTPSSP